MTRTSTPPCVHFHSIAGQASNAVDHQKRVVPCGINGSSDGRDIAAHAGGGVGLYDHDGAKSAFGVGFQAFLQCLGIDRFTIAEIENLGFDAKCSRDICPATREIAGRCDKYLVTRRKDVVQRGFPGAVAVAYVDRSMVRGAGD